ncbi:MAG: T9SS type A sorting domain-containing protein [Bacteroidales bacterium]|nr:T9SS type A sorting domain-containing protein [Bacteroidales bacterium]
MKRLLFIVIILILHSHLFAQYEGNIWYFGWKAGLDFNSGSPVAITDGQLWVDENCAVISNNAGNLLFYTNGDTVWNSEHIVMPNGTGLDGCWSSSQGVIILPSPNQPGYYYIFTIDCAENNLSAGLRYSIVQMSLNGGAGDVTVKNIPLASMVTEKITAVKHANGSDYWIITHEYGTNTFFVHLLDHTGINTIPQTFSIGSVHGNPNPPPLTGSTGGMNASHDGAKLAIAIVGNGLIEIFDFDNSSGSISNPLTFPPSLSASYSVEFSPDNSKVYVSLYTSGEIIQIDLLAGSPADIINSLMVVGSHNGTIFNSTGTLQIGPDGKIYIACWLDIKLAVIDNPDGLGMACNFLDNHIDLLGRYSILGLPQIFYNPSVVDFFSTSRCFGDSTSFSVQDNTVNGIDSVSWNFDDFSSGLSNFSKLFNPKHLFSTIGSFNVTLIYYSGVIADTVIKVVFISDEPFIDLGSDTTICFYNTVTLYAGNSGSDYIWSTGETSDSIVCTSISDTVISYYVTVTNSFGCINTDSTTVTFDPCVSIEDIKTNDRITIFPNPTKNEVFISNIEGVIIKEVNIYNQVGKRVLHDNRFTNRINVSMLYKGIYIIELISNEFILREKLIIE